MQLARSKQASVLPMLDASKHVLLNTGRKSAVCFLLPNMASLLFLLCFVSLCPSFTTYKFLVHKSASFACYSIGSSLDNSNTIDKTTRALCPAIGSLRGSPQLCGEKNPGKTNKQQQQKKRASRPSKQHKQPWPALFLAGSSRYALLFPLLHALVPCCMRVLVMRG